MDKMDIGLIKQAGLTDNEAKVYVSLIELGKSKVGKIADKSRVHRTNVYDSLKSLKKKNLVKEFEENKTKYFEATNPENLMSIIRKKQERLKSIIPELKLSMELAPKKSQVHVFEGKDAFKSMLDHFLTLKKEIYVMGAPETIHKTIPSFLENYHKRRIALKIPMHHIYNLEAVDRAKILNNMSCTESRCLPKEYDSPVSTTICGEEVMLTYWGDNPIFIHIVSQEVADVYRGYFKLLWNKSEKPK